MDNINGSFITMEIIGKCCDQIHLYLCLSHNIWYDNTELQNNLFINACFPHVTYNETFDCVAILSYVIMYFSIPTSHPFLCYSELPK